MRAVFLTAFVFIGYTWSCSQNPFSNVAIRFPDDVLRNYCGNGNFGAPEIYNPDSLNIVFTYEYGFITPAPDACVKLEKIWYVSNADFYNPLLGCISVPNPHPSPSLNNPLNLPGPTISAPGTLPPLEPDGGKDRSARPAGDQLRGILHRRFVHDQGEWSANHHHRAGL